MAKSNGNGKLEEALTALVQAQAIMVQTQAMSLSQKADTDRRIAEIDKEVAESRTRLAQAKEENTEWQRRADERFARIEAILLEHNQILRGLADKVGEKIGFKTQKNPASEG